MAVSSFPTSLGGTDINDGPEALPIVREFWRKLPPSYRYNWQLQRYEEMFEDWDCSIEAFEGIRSQDILPLLLDQFCFHMFLGFANVIDPFIDRSFGPNFDATAEWDRAFIDEVNRRDKEEMLSGRIKPTHMFAVVGKKPASRLLFQEPLSPEFCVRPPTVHPNANAETAAEVLCPLDAYQRDAWPHAPERELAIVCGWLSNAEDVIQHLRSELVRVDQLSKERTAWALQLDMEVEQLNLQLGQRTAWAQRLDKEVQELSALVGERTGWAQRVDKELERSDALAQQLARALEERTALALNLDQKLKSLDWVRRVDEFLRKLFRRHS
jgi:hypothetical protein